MLARTCLLASICALASVPSSLAADPVTAVAYSPDGKSLAAGTRGRVVLIDAAGGFPRAVLEGVAGAVTALQYAPDGKSLVVAAGEPGVSGELRLYAVADDGTVAAEPGRVIEAHADLIYGLDVSPDSALIATAGYDHLIHLWDRKTGEHRRELKDHSDAVYGLAFSPDGSLLASASADRAVKVWDVAAGKRLFTLSDPTDWVYAVAWSPDGKSLAAGGVDRSVRLWKVARDGGSLSGSAFAHQGAVRGLAFAADGESLFTLGEDDVVKAWDVPKLAERKAFAARPATAHALALSPDASRIALGEHDGGCVLLDADTGEQRARPLPTHFAPLGEGGAGGSPRTGRSVELPVTVAGAIDRAGDADFFRFRGRAGEQVGARVTGRGGLAPVLEIVGPDGAVLVESESGATGIALPADGEYAVGIRDRDYRGNPAMAYSLDVGPVPVVTGVKPLGGIPGVERTFRLLGANLAVAEVTFAVPAGAAAGSRHALPLPKTPAGETPNGTAWVYAGEFPGPDGEILRAPVTADGSLDGTPDEWRFAANEGEELILEVHADRFGSPLDPYLEILADDGSPLARCALRCIARTFTVFRDADSVRPGIRIEAWNELAVDDLLYLDGELIRVLALPKNPDDDCQFFAVGGKRLGYLGTTPGYRSLGTPLYKVEVHPPGASFPPNGMPVFELPWRNDDGGPGFGRDPMIHFTPPATGVYRVRVGDSRGTVPGGPAAYRLTVRHPRPDFSASLAPKAPKVWKGNGVPVRVSVDRADGFDGPVRVELTNLPAGFASRPSSVEAGHTTADLTLFAAADAPTPDPKSGPMKLVASATIGGRAVTREADAGLPSLAEPGDLTTRTDRDALTLRPGGEAKLTVTIERREGFNGRVPLDVRGLPHGVRVLDIGLNGILILPGETSRVVTLYADPWVAPTERPMVILSRREGTNAEHAAAPVMLTVTGE